MTDTVSKEQRSRNMAKIKSKNTLPELIIRKNLFKRGYRYRIHDKRIFGTPDIVLKKYHAVVFIQGCFWHMHVGCKECHFPKSNQGFWLAKLQRNADRDRQTKETLLSIGWRVCWIWECSVTNASRREQVIEKLSAWLHTSEPWICLP